MKNKDMTTGKPLKMIIFFMIPVFLGNLFQQFYNMADAIIVGRLLGEEALAAVGSTGSIMFLVLGFNIGICQGFGILISQAYGAKNHERLKHYVAVTIILGLIISAIMTALMVPLSESILRLMRTPENILRMSNDYISVIYAGIIAMTFFNIASSILRAIGDSKTPLYFLIIASILNIVLDIVFIAAPMFRMGPEGAAYATVISQGVAAILCFAYMFKNFEMLRFSRNHFYLDWKTVKHMLSLGIPMAVNMSVTASGIMVLQSGINVFGSSAVAAYTAASRVEMIGTQSMPALGLTMATYCGQNLGAGLYDRIFNGMRKAFYVCFVLVGIAMLVAIFLKEPIIRLFLGEPTETIMHFANTYLNTVIWFYIPLSFIFLYRSAIQGLGHGFVPLMGGILELVGRSIPILFFLDNHGFIVASLASPIAWIITGFPLMFFYFHWKRKTKRKLNSQEQPHSVATA